MNGVKAWLGATALSLAVAFPASAADWAKPLADGFESGDFAKAGGLYYKDNSEQRAGTVEFQSAEKLHGAAALKLSVKPLCAKSDEDCSERAEIWERTKLRAPYDQGIWYGFAVKLAEPVPADDHRYLIAQWKREIGPGTEGDFSPFLALRLRNGKLFATVETNYIEPAPSPDQRAAPTCGPDSVPVWLRPETNQMRFLIAAEDGWTDEDGALFSKCSRALTITRPCRSFAFGAFGLDRLRYLHQAWRRRVRTHRHLCRRQAHRDRDRPYRPRGTRASATTSISSSDRTVRATTAPGPSITTISAGRRNAGTC